MLNNKLLTYRERLKEKMNKPIGLDIEVFILPFVGIILLLLLTVEFIILLPVYLVIWPFRWVKSLLKKKTT